MFGHRREVDRDREAWGPGLCRWGLRFPELRSACKGLRPNVLSLMDYFRAFWVTGSGNHRNQGSFLSQSGGCSTGLIYTCAEDTDPKSCGGSRLEDASAGLLPASEMCRVVVGEPWPQRGHSTYPGDGAYRGGQQNVVFEFPTITHCG